MKGLRERTGGLSWQLTVSYVVVTLIAALTLGIAITVRQLIRGDQQTISPQQILQKQVPPGLASYLEAPAPDVEALRYWFAIPLYDTLDRESGQVAVVAILDRTGAVVASAACGRADLTASSAPQCALTAAQKTAAFLTLPQAQADIRDALAENAPSTPVTGATPGGDGFLVMAIPGQTKSVAGVVLAEFSGAIHSPGSLSLGPGDILAQFGAALQPEWLVIVLLASVLGTLSGVLISRRLRWRLVAIAHAASDWSQGEFGATVHDVAHDEVGRLALDLNHMAAQLAAMLAVRRELGVLEERQRLQRELHDAVKQQVFAAQMQLAATRTFFQTEPEKAYQHLLEAENLSGRAQQELTALIQELRPIALANQSIAPALTEVCRVWARQTGIQVEIEIADPSPISARIEEVLVRVTQEALANIARHSQATCAWITLGWESSVLRLSIRDNGHGFEVTTQVQVGVGLRSIRERVERVGGTLDLASTEQGTQVEVHIAVEHARGRGVTHDDRTDSRGNS